MKTATAKQAKIVLIIATYIWKSLNRVCFTVRSSNGTDTYNTCFENGHGTCTCPAKPGTCYHIKQLAPIAVAKLSERDRKAAAKEVAGCATSSITPVAYRIKMRDGRFFPQHQYPGEQWDCFWTGRAFLYFGSAYEAREHLKYTYGAENVEVVSAYSAVAEAEQVAADAEADPMVSRIERGKLVTVRWSQLTQDEKWLAYQNYEASLGC